MSATLTDTQTAPAAAPALTPASATTTQPATPANEEKVAQNSTPASSNKFVDRFYDIDQQLSSLLLVTTEKPVVETEKQAMFEELIQVKGIGSASKLAAQLIPKYIKFFPEKTEAAVNALFDLCEDVDDVGTRVLAARGLPQVAQIYPEHTSKLAHVLVQLLQAEYPIELDNIKYTLIQLMQIDIKGVLESLFNHIIEGSELLRARAIAFLKEKVLTSKTTLFNPIEDTEKFLALQIKRVMEDVTSTEFHTFMGILFSLSIYAPKPECANNIIELLAMIERQADFAAKFDPKNSEQLDRMLSCLEKGARFAKQNSSLVIKIVNHLATTVFTVFEQLADPAKLSLIKALVDVSPHLTVESINVLLPLVFNVFLVVVPETIVHSERKEKIEKPEKTDAPSAQEDAAASNKPEQDSIPEPAMNFSLTEALLFCLHRLSSKTPAFIRSMCGFVSNAGQPADFAAKDDPQHIDFMNRLKLLESSIMVYNKQAKQRIQSLNSIKAQTSKEIALVQLLIQTTFNIHALVQALLKRPPTLHNESSSIRPSWKPAKKAQPPQPQPQRTQPKALAQESARPSDRKRPAPQQIDGSKQSAPKRARIDLYVPPLRRGVTPNTQKPLQQGKKQRNRSRKQRK